MSGLIRLAAVQMRSGILPEGNLAAISEAVAAAAKGGAHYVLTPEIFGIVCAQFNPIA